MVLHKYTDPSDTQLQLVYYSPKKDRVPFGEDIMKSLFSEDYVGRFKSENCVMENTIELEKEKNWYMLYNPENDRLNVWEFCENATDMDGFTIPNTYFIKKIGFLTDN